MDKIKAAVTTVFAALSAWLGILAVPMYLLILSNLADYVTGMIASVYRKEPLSSYRSILGIVKKVCMWLLVGVGAIVDWLLLYAGNQVGIQQTTFQFAVASLVAVWLITNELLSILENIQVIGVKLPPFLVRMLQGIQQCAEEEGNTLAKEDDSLGQEESVLEKEEDSLEEQKK